MSVAVTSIFVDDQEKALRFYADVLGFVPRHDVPLGPEARWLTVVAADQPDGVELLLEPNTSPVAQAYQRGVREAGLPMLILATDDVHREHERLTGLGVRFTMPPTPTGPVVSAVFEDTCGNLLSLQQPAA
ncbi:VOC family protein [Micromonospora sp. WMMD882]|uniref:VOC family protein n=1 Tax=Micromonospora sp. WMMD882 TaxID=3015151 RepID=UPI00248BB6BF|nr:VOC family protein [Micromonospora sp. WMMD882]WBB82330.1 VOC family protein [Micromonospora sp. WMMD882]